MKKNYSRNLIFFLIMIFVFPTGSFGQTKIGLLPIRISFDKKDERSSKERLADIRARLEELKNKKKSDDDEVEDNNKDEEKGELNEYEEQFVIMLTKNLKDYLAKEEIELTEINVEEMSKEERKGEKTFYSNASRNIIAQIAKEASKGKFKKLKTSALENEEPSVFIQTVAKKYEKEYAIYMSVTGSYENTIKNKLYRVNKTNLKGVSGSLNVNLLIFEKTKGKMIYLTKHSLANYSRSSPSGILSGASIYDKLFVKFGKKVAKKIKKAID